jgi:hypothetical protein
MKVDIKGLWFIANSYLLDIDFGLLIVHNDSIRHPIDQEAFW